MLQEMAARKALATKRNEALAAGNIALYQELNRQIVELPMTGVPALTAKDRWSKK